MTPPVLTLSPKRNYGYDRLPRARRADVGRIQPDRLHERSVARRIPRRESYPRLPRGVERNRESLGPVRAGIGRLDDLPIDLLAVAPHDFDERQRERPLEIGVDGPPG